MFLLSMLEQNGGLGALLEWPSSFFFSIYSPISRRYLIYLYFRDFKSDDWSRVFWQIVAQERIENCWFLYPQTSKKASMCETGVFFGRVLGVFNCLRGFLSIWNCLLLCYELKLFLKGRKIQWLFACWKMKWGDSKMLGTF